MFGETFYELEVTQSTSGTFGQNKEEFDNAYDAETRCDSKMATGVKAQNTLNTLELVIGSDGTVVCNEYFSKVPIGGQVDVKYHLLYVETYNDGTEKSVAFSRHNDLASCVGAFFTRKADSRTKENLETAMAKVFNSKGGFEEKYCYAWDKNPAPKPEPTPEPNVESEV